MPAAGWEEGTGTLYVRLRGARRRWMPPAAHGRQRLDAASTAADWAACRELPALVHRACGRPLPVAPVRAADCARAGAAAGTAAPLVEWHGGLRWVQAPRSAGAALAARAVGGDALLFSAEARSPQRQPLFDPQNAAVQRIRQQLKTAFDPAGIFNPDAPALRSDAVP
jgi:glycolate oxidase FAD binding subunit